MALELMGAVRSSDWTVFHHLDGFQDEYNERLKDTAGPPVTLALSLSAKNMVRILQSDVMATDGLKLIVDTLC